MRRWPRSMNTTNAVTASTIAKMISTRRIGSSPVCAMPSVCTTARRKAGDDAGEDQQRNAVADAALGDLLAEPHQEHRAGGEADDRREDEARTRRVDDAAAGSAASLATPNAWNTASATVPKRVYMVDLAPARLAFLAQRLPGSGSPTRTSAR